MTRLIKGDFKPPAPLQSTTFQLEILAPDLAELDYKALMSCKERLRTAFGIKTSWPKDEFTLADNIEDLIMHLAEFESGKAYAYSILTPAKDKALGTVYIDPSRVPEFECEIMFWLIDEATDLESFFYQEISVWIKHNWPFNKVAYPGRNISWQEWNQLLAQQDYSYSEAENQKRRDDAAF